MGLTHRGLLFLIPDDFLQFYPSRARYALMEIVTLLVSLALSSCFGDILHFIQTPSTPPNYHHCLNTSNTHDQQFSPILDPSEHNGGFLPTQTSIKLPCVCLYVYRYICFSLLFYLPHAPTTITSTAANMATVNKEMVFH